MEENEVQVREGISSDGGDTTLAISKVVFFFFSSVPERADASEICVAGNDALEYMAFLFPHTRHLNICKCTKKTLESTTYAHRNSCRPIKFPFCRRDAIAY